MKITKEQIIHVIDSYATNVHEIAEQLQVSVKLLSKKLEFLSKKKNMLDLINNKFLTLQNKPPIKLNYNKILIEKFI